MPLIVEALLDGAAITKYEVVVSTLGQVIQSTGFKLFKILFDKFLVCNVHGYVITPYNEYPQLLGFLLKLLNGELAWSTRREVLKVLGIMGALDPHVHKHNQQSLPGSHGEVTWVTGDPGQHIRSMDELPTDLWPSFATFEDYFSTVAINSLMRILRDPSLSSYHRKVVFPDLYHIVWICEGGLKEFITWKLGTLVSIARQKFAKPELKSCIEEFEEKLNKFDIERKEQELIAKNAQSHQQKVESLDNITVIEKEEEEISEFEITGAYTLS
uniref:Serine/threonine-protein kinase TOR n=1 Tax=Solanum tuberosum TaxID=4113 RepID=M0ZYG6_SOLTU